MKTPTAWLQTAGVSSGSYATDDNAQYYEGSRGLIGNGDNVKGDAGKQRKTPTVLVTCRRSRGHL
jgi:hypothetical protein